MTDAKPFQKLRDLVGHTTPGPWGFAVNLAYDADEFIVNGPRTISEGCTSSSTEYVEEADAMFIAEARNSVTKLLEYVDRLRQALQTIRDMEASKTCSPSIASTWSVADAALKDTQ